MKFGLKLLFFSGNFNISGKNLNNAHTIDRKPVKTQFSLVSWLGNLVWLEYDKLFFITGLIKDVRYNRL